MRMRRRWMEVLLVLLYAPLGHPHSHPLYGRGGPQSGMERGTRGEERRSGKAKGKNKAHWHDNGSWKRVDLSFWRRQRSGRVGWPLLAVGMSTNDDFSLPLVFSQTALDQDQKAVCYSVMQQLSYSVTRRELRSSCCCCYTCCSFFH